MRQVYYGFDTSDVESEAQRKTYMPTRYSNATSYNTNYDYADALSLEAKCPPQMAHEGVIAGVVDSSSVNQKQKYVAHAFSEVIALMGFNLAILPYWTPNALRE